MLINKIWKGEFIPKKSPSTKRDFSVRVIGLEPTHLAAPDPKSGVSTNFTIPAVDL